MTLGECAKIFYEQSKESVDDQMWEDYKAKQKEKDESMKDEEIIQNAEKREEEVKWVAIRHAVGDICEFLIIVGIVFCISWCSVATNKSDNERKVRELELQYQEKMLQINQAQGEIIEESRD